MTHSNNMSREDAGVLSRVLEMAAYLKSDRDDAAWPAQLDKPGSATRLATARDLHSLLVWHSVLTEQNRRVKLVMGGALTMLAGYDADAANELRAALKETDRGNES